MKKPNIIFFMLDTVRADFLGAYGGSAETSVMDGLAVHGKIYLNAVAPATYTAPSHLAVFTGMGWEGLNDIFKNPITNRNSNTDPFLSKTHYISARSKNTVAEELVSLGYSTWLLSNNPFVSRPTGLADGFSFVENFWFRERIDYGKYYIKYVLKLIDSDFARENLISLAYLLTYAIPDRMVDSTYVKLRKNIERRFLSESGSVKMDRGAEKTNEMLGRISRSDHFAPLFVFVNYMEGHEGYPVDSAPGGIVQDKWFYLGGLSDKSHTAPLKDAYRRRIEYLDGMLGKALGEMADGGILDNAIVIVAGDHGQGFMEHDQMYHNMFPYQEISHVPLIITRFSNGKPVGDRESIYKPVSLRGLCNFIKNAGAGSDYSLEDFSSATKDVRSDHFGITEVWDMSILEHFRKKSRTADAIYRAKMRYNTFSSALYSGRFKLLHYADRRIGDQLFDLKSDSGEEENIIMKNRVVARSMLRHLGY
jgi:arylsulfatase A-like enzyme